MKELTIKLNGKKRKPYPHVPPSVLVIEKVI